MGGEKLQSKEEGRGCGQRGEDERAIDGQHPDGEKHRTAGAGAQTVPADRCCSHWSPAGCCCLAFHVPVKQMPRSLWISNQTEHYHSCFINAQIMTKKNCLVSDNQNRKTL